MKQNENWSVQLQDLYLELLVKFMLLNNLICILDLKKCVLTYALTYLFLLFCLLTIRKLFKKSIYFLLNF